MKLTHFFSIGIIALFALGFNIPSSIWADEHPTLPIGAKAPDFKLVGVDGKTYTLASFNKAGILMIVFTCNHCPTAQAYEDRIIQLTADYADKNVAVVAIMPNDPKSITLNELNYTDMGDSFEEMKMRAREKKFNFPYLYDGDTEKTAIAYGPVATPHIFIFDKERKLRYNGRFDDTEKPSKTPRTHDTRDAIEALLHNQEVPVKTTKVFGCSIKWAEKKEIVQQSFNEWAKEPVSVDSINEEGIKNLLKNNSDKLRLINVWATSSAPSTKEFPDLVTINRMYRSRDFEFISINADNPENRSKVIDLLQKNQASNKNYLLNTNDKHKLIEAIAPAWQGDLPYTILVEPGGKIIYAKQGAIDPAELKKVIVNDPLIGRYYF